ncbi:MAG: rhodanese-like domain-containing protein [Chloroflexi bacterium]|nr:rhodanese-like domain-containing protein [Chloroflexota bacterium]
MLPTIPGVDVTEAARRRGPDGAGALLVDVRELPEFAEVRAEGVVLLPMSSLPARLAELPIDRELLFICRSGARSGQVTAYLRAQGRQDVFNVEGGMIAWERAGLPVRTGPPEPAEGELP